MTERLMRRRDAEALLAELRDRYVAEALELPKIVPYAPAETFEERWRVAVDELTDRMIAWYARRLVELTVEGSA